MPKLGRVDNSATGLGIGIKVSVAGQVAITTPTPKPCDRRVSPGGIASCPSGLSDCAHPALRLLPSGAVHLSTGVPADRVRKLAQELPLKTVSGSTGTISWACVRIKRQAFDILTVFAGVAIVSGRRHDRENRLILAMKVFSTSFSINLVPVMASGPRKRGALVIAPAASGLTSPKFEGCPVVGNHSYIHNGLQPR